MPTIELRFLCGSNLWKLDDTFDMGGLAFGLGFVGTLIFGMCFGYIDYFMDNGSGRHASRLTILYGNPTWLVCLVVHLIQGFATWIQDKEIKFKVHSSPNSFFLEGKSLS